MTVYFKATRTDGTDFRTGTVDYAAALASGEPLPLLTREGGYACCTDTVYHASDVPAETLVGGSWLCRLFEVTGDPVAQEGHKFGFRTLTVTREIPAWQALGPNGESVAALIARTASLTGKEILSLAAAWAAAGAAAGDAAWDAARAAARDAAWVAAWVAAGDAAGDTARAAARDSARDSAWDAAEDAARDAARAAAWVAAGAAARAAARALVVQDLITEDQFKILYGPWRSVMGDL